MPVLANPKHELFAQAIAKGKTATEAYVLAGYKDDDAHASRLAGNGRVKERVTELQTKVAERVVERAAISKAWVLGELQGNHNAVAKGIEKGELTALAASNRALELIGKELGMFVERKEIGGAGAFSNMSREELLAQAAEDAAALGLDLPKAKPGMAKTKH